MGGHLYKYIFYWGTHHLTAIAASEGTQIPSIPAESKTQLGCTLQDKKKIPTVASFENYHFLADKK